LLARCLAGDPPVTLPPALLDDECGHALFGIFVEGLADRFEPALCGMYARLFAQAISRAVPGTDASALVERYQRVRRPHPLSADPRRVFVLSRVTLGADVAVTSVLLDAARRRFPRAEICFAGPAKNYELFAAGSGIVHTPVEYRRGSLRERLAVWNALSTLLSDSGCVVLDPDSRLTQLGLLPVCEEDRYRLFESRAYGAASGRSLPELTAAWTEEILGVAGAKPWLALPRTPRRNTIAVSLGVGENPAKRLPGPFEEQLLRLLAGTGLAICIDRGAGGEEAERVARAVERSGAAVDAWNGSFAGFASIIVSSRLYIGYDSAGQHVAAASGVPLITIFAGFPSPRMFDRWRPVSPRATVIRVDQPDPPAVLERVRAALAVAL